MKILTLIATLPFMVAPAMAAPYVESKTTGALVDGDYKGAQTELRVGYENKLENGVTLFAEGGPGYEFVNGGDGQSVAVGEVGVSFPIANNLTGKVKVAGEYGFDSEVFGVGGEVKVRYTF